MKKLIFTCLCCCLVLACLAQTTSFEYSLSKKGEMFFLRKLDNYKGKYLILQIGKSLEPDEMLLVDLQSQKRVNLPGFAGKPNRFLMHEKKGLLIVLTLSDYDKSGDEAKPHCFVYDLETLTLKHTIIGNYFHILAVDGDQLVLQEGKQLGFFSLQTGAMEKEHTLSIPGGYYGVESSTLHGNRFISIIDSSQKKQQVYWENIDSKENKLIALPEKQKNVSSDTFGSQVKWFATLKEDQPYGNQKMIAYGFNISTGEQLYRYESGIYIKKIKVNQLDGRVLLQASGDDEMLVVKDGQVKGYPLDIRGDEIYWSPDQQNLVASYYKQLLVYNIQMAQTHFMIGGDLDDAMTEYEPISYIRGTNKVLYADNSNDKTLKLGIVELKYPEKINFSFPADNPSRQPSLMVQDGHSKAPTDIAFSARNKRMITGDESGSIGIWDVQSKMLLKRIQLQKGDEWEDDKNMLLLAVHPQHEMIAVSWQHNFIQFIDFEGRELYRLSTDAQSSVAHFSEDGKYFYYEKRNGLMAVFNIDESNMQSTYDFSTVGTIFNYAFDANSSRIALPLANYTIAILDAVTGKGIDTIKTAHEKTIFAVAFHPGGNAVASLDQYMNVAVTDLRKRTSNKVISNDKKMGSSTVTNAGISMTPLITQILFNADGQLLIPGAMGSDMKAGSIYNLLSGTYMPDKNHFSDWKLYRNSPSIDYFSKLALGDDQRTLWSVHRNNAIEVWDSKTREHVKTIPGNEECIVEFYPAENFNGFITGQASGKLRTWNMETAAFKNYDAVKFGNSLVMPNKDSSYYTHYADDILKVDLTTNEVLGKASHDSYSNWVEMTPQGALVYSDKKLLLLDLHSKKKKLLYSFTKDADYYWSKEHGRRFYCLDKEKENLFFYNPGEFKVLQFVQVHLASGKTTMHPLNLGEEKEINESFDHSDNSILFAGRNQLYRYHIATRQVTNENVLTQPAVFASSFQPALVRTSKDGAAVIFYQRSGAVENNKKEMLLELFQEKGAGPAKNFPVRNKAIRDIRFSRDQKQLYICYEKEVETWSIAEGKLLATLFLLPGDKFIIYTPDNYYFTSHKLTDIGFRVNDRIYDLTQFDLKYNRPDIVLKRLGYATADLVGLYEKAYQKRLKRLGIKEEALVSDPSSVPVVSITNKKEIELLTASPAVTLRIDGSSDAKQLNKLFIHVNGAAITGMNGQPIPTGRSLKLEKELKLSKGTNKISVHVTDEQGVESLKDNIEIVYNPAAAVKGKLYYTGVGVSNYADSNMNLTYADKDVKDIATFIKAKQPSAITGTLLNRDATRENLLALKQQFMQTNEEDIVVISLSGHGLVNKEGDFFFATHETNFTSPEKTAVAFEQLEWLLDSIPARKKLLLIDACHSGELDKDAPPTIEPNTRNISDSVKEKTNRGIIVLSKQGNVGLQNSFSLMQELFSDMSRGNGTIVISAAAGTEMALETKELQNGLFSYCVINGLINQMADTDKDGEIRIQELKNYLVEEVTRLSKGRQKPTTRKETIENNWVIWE